MLTVTNEAVDKKEKNIHIFQKEITKIYLHYSVIRSIYIELYLYSRSYITFIHKVLHYNPRRLKGLFPIKIENSNQSCCHHHRRHPFY